MQEESRDMDGHTGYTPHGLSAAVCPEQETLAPLPLIQADETRICLSCSCHHRVSSLLYEEPGAARWTWPSKLWSRPRCSHVCFSPHGSHPPLGSSPAAHQASTATYQHSCQPTRKRDRGAFCVFTQSKSEVCGLLCKSLACLWALLLPGTGNCLSKWKQALQPQPQPPGLQSIRPGKILQKIPFNEETNKPFV